MTKKLGENTEITKGSAYYYLCENAEGGEEYHSDSTSVEELEKMGLGVVARILGTVKDIFEEETRAREEKFAKWNQFGKPPYDYKKVEKEIEAEFLLEEKLQQEGTPRIFLVCFDVKNCNYYIEETRMPPEEWERRHSKYGKVVKSVHSEYSVARTSKYKLIEKEFSNAQGFINVRHHKEKILELLVTKDCKKS